jgi:hypothetical protein
MMRDGGALDIVIEEFLVAVENFQIGLEEYNSVPLTDRDNINMLADVHNNSNGADMGPPAGVPRAESDDEFSLPSRPQLSTKNSARKMSSSRRSNKQRSPPKEAETEADPLVTEMAADGELIDDEDMEALKLEVNSAQTLARVMLDLCMDFARFEGSATHMCKLRVCDGIVKFLSLHECEESKDTEPIAVDLLWTVLDSYLMQARKDSKWDEYLSAAIMDFEDAIAVLLEILLRLLRDGYRLSDKECRNEVAIVLTLLIHFPAASPFWIQSGVLITFVTYACVAEAGRRAWPFFPRPLAKSRNFANNFDIDIQFKQVLWMAISDILDLNDTEALCVVASSPLIPVLLSYLEHDSLDSSAVKSGGSVAHESPNSPNGDINRTSAEFQKSSVTTLNSHTHVKSPLAALNSSSTTSVGTSPNGNHNGNLHSNAFISTLSLTQLREMQIQAVKFLSKNVCKCVGEFLRIQGIQRVLDCTVKYYTSTCPEHKSLIYYSLLLFKRCVLGSNIAKKILSEEDCVGVCLYLLNDSDEDSTRGIAARLISILCTAPNYHRICQEQLRTHEGIRVLVLAMHAYSEKRKPLVGKKSKVSELSKGEGKCATEKNKLYLPLIKSTQGILKILVRISVPAMFPC